MNNTKYKDYKEKYVIRYMFLYIILSLFLDRSFGDKQWIGFLYIISFIYLSYLYDGFNTIYFDKKRILYSNLLSFVIVNIFYGFIVLILKINLDKNIILIKKTLELLLLNLIVFFMFREKKESISRKMIFFDNGKNKNIYFMLREKNIFDEILYWTYVNIVDTFSRTIFMQPS